MLFGFMNPKYKQESEKVFDSALIRAKDVFPTLFEKDSETKEDRDQKFEAISVFMALYIWSLQQSESNKNVKRFLERIYEEMYDRYDIALREQGVSDVKVGPTIRALAAKFRTRLEDYGDVFLSGNTKSLSDMLLDKKLCGMPAAMSISIKLEAEAKMLKKIDLEGWILHLDHPSTGKYEPHENASES